MLVRHCYCLRSDQRLDGLADGVWHPEMFPVAAELFRPVLRSLVNI